MIDATCAVVILAAGRGSRLGCTDIPKVMLPLAGKPMLGYTLEALHVAGFTSSQIVVVTGFHREKIEEAFPDQAMFVYQAEQKGTAHAAFVGMSALPTHIKHVLVMGGDDSACYTPETLADFVSSHQATGSTLSLLTARIPGLRTLGRIVRQENGEVTIVEKENLTEEQWNLDEISTGTFVFEREWFLSIFPRITPIKNLGELGLPQTLQLVKADGKMYRVMPLQNPLEWCGVNTPEELAIADERKKYIRRL